MTTRTTTSTVTFRKPFRLRAFLEPLPAGTYSIETDEELLEGVSFPAYRRTAIILHLNADASPAGVRESVILDPAQFEERLAADGVQELKAGTPGFSHEDVVRASGRHSNRVLDGVCDRGGREVGHLAEPSSNAALAFR